MITTRAIVLAVMLFVAIPCVVAGLIAVIRRRLVLQRWVRVPGTIVSLEAVTVARGSSSGRSWVPLIGFTPQNGQPVVVRPVGIFPANPPGYKIGQAVPVAYDPAQPARATIASFSSPEWMGVVLVLVGVFEAALGLFLYFFIL
jgi:hypothetical protein